MSDLTQKPAAARTPFLRGFALSLIGVAAILALAMGRFGERIVATAAQARPHAPNLDLLASLPLAIKIHLYAALAAVAIGAALMAARKGLRFHRTAGWVWVALAAAVAVSSMFITSLNHGRWSWLHLFTGWTAIVLPLAVIAIKRGSVARHRRLMMGLFYGGFAVNLLIAFIPGRTLWQVVFG